MLIDKEKEQHESYILRNLKYDEYDRGKRIYKYEQFQRRMSPPPELQAYKGMGSEHLKFNISNSVEISPKYNSKNDVRSDNIKIVDK